MRHVEKALMRMEESDLKRFIYITNAEDVVGLPPVVRFEVQSDPVAVVGVNGCQARDMLEFVKCLFESLNAECRCRENAITITKLEEALHWQDARTKDRVKRGVEGFNKC